MRKYQRDSTLHLNQLTRKLSGIVDAAVMGGIANYEKVRNNIIDSFVYCRAALIHSFIDGLGVYSYVCVLVRY